MGSLAESYREALTDPKLEAMKLLEERLIRIETKLDLILEKLTCVSISNSSSSRPKRS